MSDSPTVDVIEEPDGILPNFDVNDSIVIQRLIDEVRNENDPSLGQSTAYNRTYHRHNR